MAVWGSLGYNMIVFLAGLQSISPELYEAASIDGATTPTRFWHSTTPHISPATVLALVNSLLTSFQVFDQAYVMTNGGPANATNTIVLYIYQNGFQYFRMGYASAIAWVLFAAIFLFTLAQMRLQGHWVQYE